jgi:predicted transport protein
MGIFSITDNNFLSQVNEQVFRLEKDIQRLIESNLDLLLNLSFVKSEFSLNQFRIDTLAYDKDSKSFVIIEYKRDKNFSVIDQGYAYLSLMLNNKADFILEYNESRDTALKRSDVDWSQSKVMFISPSFTTFQKEAINFKDLPIELYEIKWYNNGTINFNKVTHSGARESVKVLSKSDDTISQVSQEIKVFTEDEHLLIGSYEISELYDAIKQRVLSLGEIEIQPKKKYIAFVGSRNIVDIHIQKSALKIWINLYKGELKDLELLARDVANIGHWGNGDYEIQIKDDEHIDYLLELNKQSWKRNKK